MIVPWLLYYLHILKDHLRPEVAVVLGHFLIGWPLYIVALTILEEPSLQIKTTTPSTSWNRPLINSLFNARGIGCTKPAPDVPYKQSLRSPTLSRAAFIRYQALSILSTLCIYTFYLYLLDNHHLLFNTKPLQSSDFLPAKQSLLRRLLTPGNVTPRELVVRLFITFQFIYPNYVALQTTHSLLSLLSVSLRLSPPSSWPPLFGPLSSITSLTTFWSTYWHSLAYRTYTTYAKLVALRILHLPKGRALTTWTIRVLVFALSGLVHACVGTLLGNRWAAGRVVGWYVAQAGGIMFEQGGWQVWTLVLEERWPQLRRWRGGLRWAGRVWVLGFFVWSLPKVLFPVWHGVLQEGVRRQVREMLLRRQGLAR
jgi:hypothetical protein